MSNAINSHKLQDGIYNLQQQSLAARTLFGDFVAFLNQTDEHIDNQLKELAAEISNTDLECHKKAANDKIIQLNGFNSACHKIKSIIINGQYA